MTISQAKKFERKCASDIFYFIRMLGIRKVTFQQKQFFTAVQEATRTGEYKISVRSGQGPGKTWASAIVGLWLLMRQKNTKVLITAPTMKQCKSVWLSQAKKHIENAHPYLKLYFRFTSTTCSVKGNDSTIWGVQLITAREADGMRGQHATNMHIICEEASGCDEEALVVLTGTQSNKDGFFIMIGNPSKRFGMFYNSHKVNDHLWKTLHWNAEETPDTEWYDGKRRNKEIADLYGRDSDYYRINVLGEFPQADPGSVIPEEMLREHLKSCKMEDFLQDRVGNKIPKQIGIDIARKGGDESVIVVRRGNSVVHKEELHNMEPKHVVHRAFDIQAMFKWSDAETLYVPDATGIGQGALVEFYENGKNVIEFHNHGKARLSKIYENKITEGWFLLKKKLLDGRLWLPSNDPILMSQICGRKYETNERSGRVILETKKEFSKRTGGSPDRADALVLAFYDIVSSGLEVLQ